MRALVKNGDFFAFTPGILPLIVEYLPPVGVVTTIANGKCLPGIFTLPIIIRTIALIDG